MPTEVPQNAACGSLGSPLGSLAEKAGDAKHLDMAGRALSGRKEKPASS